MSNIRKGKLHASVSSQAITIASVGKTLIEMPHSTAGQTVLLDITGLSESLDFAASFAGASVATCGITATADWAQAMPWFIYLVNGTNASAGVKVLMSRNPCMTTTPAEGYFHYSDAAADTDDQTSVCASYADGTDYSSKPVVLIGACTMTYSTTGDQWTPSLTTVGGCTEDALRDVFSVEYRMPPGQNGCGDASEVFDQGGAATALNFGPTSWAYYAISSNGWVDLNHSHSNQATNGGAATIVRWYGPYSSAATAAQSYEGSGRIYLSTVWYTIWAAVTSGTNYAIVYAQAASANPVNSNSFSNTADEIWLQVRYRAFK